MARSPATEAMLTMHPVDSSRAGSGRLGQQEGAGEVDLDDPAPLVGVDVGDRPPPRRCRPRWPGCRAARGVSTAWATAAAHEAGVGHVAADAAGESARGRAPTTDGALGGQAVGHGRPDPAGRARDERHPARRVVPCAGNVPAGGRAPVLWRAWEPWRGRWPWSPARRWASAGPSAQIFAREGAAVVVADIDEDGGRETVALVEAAGGRAGFVRTDVSVRVDVAAMVDLAVDTFGGLDCAHNNAGIAAPMAPLADYPDDGWDRTLAVMLTGVYHCMKAEIPAMLARGGGAIVNTASGVGLVGLPPPGRLHRVQARGDRPDQGGGPRLRGPGHPGQRRLPGHGPDPDGRRGRAAPARRSTPTCRPSTPSAGSARPSEVAEAAVWLCTPAASFVLGVALPVDGGYVVP